MIYQVLKATCENPIKNDFVKTCEKYLEILDIKLSFSEIENLSQWSFKKLVKEKTKQAGLKYLLLEKVKQATKPSDGPCPHNPQVTSFYWKYITLFALV